MGKKGGISWFTAVKRAFSSPTKENEKKSSKRREVNEQEDDEKRREKRRWLFRIPTTKKEQQCETKMTTNITAPPPPDHLNFDAKQKHAIAVATATAAAASAAATTAQAAVEIIRLTRPSKLVREQYAAVVIQIAFRGYLARRALRALKGIVKLQALVRGHNVRTQAKMVKKCRHALARVQAQAQAQVGDRRSKLSHEGSRKSMFAETNGLWESRYLQDIRDRKSTSRDGSGIADDWDDRLHRLEGIREMLQNRKEAALKREKSLAYDFSHKISRTGRNKSFGNESELEGRTKWLDRWMATKQWESSRVSTDKKDSIKTFGIDTSKPYSYSAPNHTRKPHHQSHQQQASPRSVASPHNRAYNHSTPYESPRTPPPSKIRQLSVRSMSPRCLKEERSYSTTHTPNLGSYCFTGVMCRARVSVGAATSPMPNYMAVTESAKAKIRSQSTPRTRPSTPEREQRSGSARKRLTYPVVEPHNNSIAIGHTSVSQNLRSPSFKSVECNFGMEQQSNLYSYYTDSLGGDISSCSTTELRRWLR